jgi:hypothetical protein
VPFLEEIQGWNLTVMADVMEIQPTKKWITMFQPVIGNEWKANTSMEWRRYILVSTWLSLDFRLELKNDGILLRECHLHLVTW